MKAAEKTAENELNNNKKAIQENISTADHHPAAHSRSPPLTPALPLRPPPLSPCDHLPATSANVSFGVLVRARAVTSNSMGECHFLRRRAVLTGQPLELLNALTLHLFTHALVPNNAVSGAKHRPRTRIPCRLGVRAQPVQRVRAHAHRPCDQTPVPACTQDRRNACVTCLCSQRQRRPPVVGCLIWVCSRLEQCLSGSHQSSETVI